MKNDKAQSPAEDVAEVPGMVVGFVGKAEGLKDVLHERGQLNSANLSGYTLQGTKGVGGVVGESPSFLSRMAKLDDIKDETTAMHIRNADALVVALH
jgi:hypothetical protein